MLALAVEQTVHLDILEMEENEKIFKRVWLLNP
jgi:hypothetical protein